MTIDQQLRDAIRDSGESAYALAARSGVSIQQITRYLSGERSMQIETAAKIADALGLTLTPAKKKSLVST